MRYHNCLQALVLAITGFGLALPVAPNVDAKLSDPVVSIQRQRRAAPSVDAELSDLVVSIQRRAAPNVNAELSDPVVSIQ